MIGEGDVAMSTSSITDKSIINSSTNSEKKNDPFTGFEQVALNEMNTVAKIHIRSFRFQTCPVCGIRLYKSFAAIPINQTTGVAYPFFSCGYHFFAWPSKKLKRILGANKYTRKISIDRSFYFPESGQLKEFLEKSAIKPLVFLLMQESASRREIVVISNQYREISSECHILPYTDKNARQLLTEVFHNESKNSIQYDGENYNIYELKEFEQFSLPSVGYNYIASDVTIKTGGGFQSHIKNNYCEIVDVLLYSPRTKRYEPIHATYDSREGECFIDITLFRNFINEFGNPGIKVYPGISFGGSFLNRDLSDESLLHAYGYNVNSNDNLNDAERQSMIAEIIDLELMQQRKIVDLLTWLVKTRKNVRLETKNKWERDIVFTLNYKANPSRFLIYG